MQGEEKCGDDIKGKAEEKECWYVWREGRRGGIEDAQGVGVGG